MSMYTPTPISSASIASIPTEQSGQHGSTKQCGDDIQVPTQSSIRCEETNDLANVNDVERSTMEGSLKRRETSVAWKHFKKQKVNGVVSKAQCNYCKNFLSANSKNGTKHLIEHSKRCHSRNTSDIKQALLVANRTVDGKMQLQNHSFDPQLARLHLAYMIIMHEYPLRMVEHKWFKVFLNTLQPLFKPISRNTLRLDILKIFGEEKKKIMDILESNKSRIAITTDMWTFGNQNKGYMAITAHFIDNSWKLHSRIVRFVYVPCPLTAEVIVDVLFECLIDWNIDRKLSTLTLDNCSTNDSLVTILSMLVNRFSPNSLLLGGQILHMRCAAHILNFIVGDGLDSIKDSIERIRDSVYYRTATQKRVENSEETARQLHINSNKTFAHDVKTRWNSTYFMLSTALLYKNVFPCLKQCDSTYKGLPTEHDWLLASEVCDRLELFYVLTEMFSATKCPTANKIFIYIYETRLQIENWADSDYVAVNIMARNMIEKFRKYWEDIHKIVSITVILDPRFKFKTIDYYFDVIYADNSENEKKKVREIMCEFEKEYKSSTPKPKPTAESNSSSSLASKWLDFGKINIFGGIETLGVYLSGSTATNEKLEFDSYLEEALLPNDADFDILTWWKTQGVKYHTLRLIARDIYVVAVSTVASEAAFSTSGRVVNKHRSRLIPETLEALMWSQYWLWERLDASSSKPPYRVVNSVTTYSSDEDEEETGVTTLF